MVSLFRRAAARAAAVAAVSSVGLLPTAEVGAATLVYRNDAQLVALSDRVVHGRVLDVHTEWAPGRRTIYTVARIAVLEDLTGLSDPVIEVRELGGAIDGVRMVVPGTPTFVPGQDLVLCLERHDAARWRTVALEFSTFRVQPQADGDPMLTRDAAESIVVNAPAFPDRSRRLSALRATVARVKGAKAVRPGGERFIADAEAARAQQGESRADAPFTLLNDMRWRQPDTDIPVRWYKNPAASAPTTELNVTLLIQRALQAWTDPASARINLIYSGDRAIGGEAADCPQSYPDAGLISFEDPFDEMGPGILALGGGCTSGAAHVVNNHTFDTLTHGFVLFNNASELAPDVRTGPNFTRILAHEIGHGIGLGHTCEITPGTTTPCSTGMDVNLMYPTCCSTAMPNPPAIGPDDLAGVQFIYPMPSGPPPPPTDADSDGLPDAWETSFGLSPGSAAGDNGASGDPDHDGVTNAVELQQNTHPRGFQKRYFAEGVVNGFFETQIALLNPGATPAIALLRIQPQDQPERFHRVEVPARSRRTVSTATLGGLTVAPFSTLIESDVAVVADRTLAWTSAGYGSHTETALLDPSTIWYLAEGATGGGFQVFYLLQNPNTAAVTVRVTYLLPFGQTPFIKDYTVGAKSRVTIYVDEEQFPEGSGNKPLAATDLSAKLEVINSGGPIIVERAMYFTPGGGPTQAAGHDSAGVTDAQFRTVRDGWAWFFAEGATGSFFDTYILIANPGTTEANVTATYLLTSGQTFQKTYRVLPQSRETILVDEEEIPAGSGVKPLQAVEVSTTLTSNVPVIAERAMWWPQGGWYEAHNVVGSISAGPRWAIADGEAGGARNAQTFLLVANVSAEPANIRVTLMTESGQTISWPSAAGPGHTIPARSRFTVPVDDFFFAGINNQRFGAVVESLGGHAIVVERANYYNTGPVQWSSGAAALGAKLP